jgi:hypothetical protein
MIYDKNRVPWQPMEDWPLAYRFVDERWNKLDAETVATIHPLKEESALELAELNYLHDLTALAQSNMLSRDWQIRTIEDDEDGEALRTWLMQRRPDADDDVFVEWVFADPCAAVVAWKTFCRYFDDFWYPFETVLVSDDTHTWQLLFGPNDLARWRALKGHRGPSKPRRGTPKLGLGQISDLGKYMKMKESGVGPRGLFMALVGDGAITLEAIRVLRAVFGLSLADALKEAGLPEPRG